MTSTLLAKLCDHALSFGADSLKVEREHGEVWVYAGKDGTPVRIAHFKISSGHAEELFEDLNKARKGVRAIIGGRRVLIQVHLGNDTGNEAFAVTMEPITLASPGKFTAKQGQYLAFIFYYTKLHGCAPSEADMQAYFKVSPPSVHQMVVTLEANDLIERRLGVGRSIRLLIPREALPELE